jgi:hypothetical protein
MRLWPVVCMALGVACSFDSTPRVRPAGATATSDRNVIGLFYDGGATSDAPSVSDAGRSVDPSDLPDSHEPPRSPSDAGAPPVNDSAVKPPDPSLMPDAQSPPKIMMSSDAAMMPRVREGETPPPPPAPDAAMPPTNAAGSGGATSPAPNPTLQLLKAAQFSRDGRAFTALLAALVAQAKTGAELGQVLATLDSDGQCAFVERANCLMACGVVATRCSLCISDPDCAAELQQVCGVSAPNCR